MYADIYESMTGLKVETHIQQMTDRDFLIEQSLPDCDMQLINLTFDDIKFLYQLVQEAENEQE